MAQFDVYRLDGGPDLVVAWQAERYADLPARFVVPLYFLDEAPARIIPRLTPVFKLLGHEFVLFQQYALSAEASVLGAPVASLAHDYFRILAAIDLLLTGV